MNCSKCGAENSDDAGNCVICGTPLAPPEQQQQPAAPAAPEAAPTVEPQPPTAEPPPPNYLVWAILSTLFCCWPTGIVAIVFAAQVSSKMQAGDVEGARRASSTAKLWCWITFGLGLTGLFLAIVFAVIGSVAGY